MEYKNYYTGETEWILFEFEGLTKEESLRIQAYLLKDNDIYVNDSDPLTKISDEYEPFSLTKEYSASCIYIKKDPKEQGHYILTGYKKTVDDKGEFKTFNLIANIYEGLNFISMVCITEDRKTLMHTMLSSCWCCEKSKIPNRLTCYKTVKLPGEEDKYTFNEYTVDEPFSIKSDPSEIFKEKEKDEKSLIKTK